MTVSRLNGYPTQLDERDVLIDVDGVEHLCGPDGWPLPTAKSQTFWGSLQAGPQPWDEGWFTVDELDAADLTQEFHLPGLIPCGQPMLVGGADKTTKTTQLLDMGMCCSSGETFGVPSVDGETHTFTPEVTGPFAFVTCESGAIAIRATMRQIAKSHGHKTLRGAYPNVFLRTMKYDLCNPRTIITLARLVVAKKIKVLAFDPVYLMFSGIGDDASNQFLMGGYLEPYTRIARDYGVSVILIHHFSKGAVLNSVGKKPELSWLSMAGFGAWARAWILFSRRTPYDHKRPGVHSLHMIAGGAAYSGDYAVDVDEGFNGGRFEIAIRDGEAVAEADAVGKIEKKVAARHEAKEKTAIRNAGNLLQLIEKRGGPINMADAKSGTGVKLDPADVNTAMTRLMDAGDVKAVQFRHRNGKIGDGWALPSWRGPEPAIPAIPAIPVPLVPVPAQGRRTGTELIGGLGEVPLCSSEVATPPTQESAEELRRRRQAPFREQAELARSIRLSQKRRRKGTT